MSAVYPSDNPERDDPYKDNLASSRDDASRTSSAKTSDPRSIIDQIRESINKIRFQYVCETDERIKECIRVI